MVRRLSCLSRMPRVLLLKLFVCGTQARAFSLSDSTRSPYICLRDGLVRGRLYRY